MPAKQRKIAVMGSRSVGKSSLAIQFVQGQFVDSYDPTIENTFTKNLKYKGQEYEVLVVDTAGRVQHFPDTVQRWHWRLHPRLLNRQWAELRGRSGYIRQTCRLSRKPERATGSRRKQKWLAQRQKNFPGYWPKDGGRNESHLPRDLCQGQPMCLRHFHQIFNANWKGWRFWWRGEERVHHFLELHALKGGVGS